MISKLVALVMAGGQGKRFWPCSTSKKPKQYLNLLGENSLLTDTLDRFDGVVEKNDRFIVTVNSQVDLAKEQSESKINENGIILEPSGRNTAPCILLSLAYLENSGVKDDDVVFVVPSDHVILNTNGFSKVVKNSYKWAFENDSIITIGIPPHFPHTGYGYIKKSDELGCDHYKVDKFVEKPNVERAKEYLSSGDYVWNAGMFMGKLKVFKDEFEKVAPSFYQHYQELKQNLNNPELLEKTYSKLEKESIDYALMEKSSKIHVTDAKFDWNDLGSWDALEQVIDKSDANIVAKAKKTCFLDAKENIVFAPNKNVTLIDVNDLVVISQDENIVVLPKSKSQRVKEAVEFWDKK